MYFCSGDHVKIYTREGSYAGCFAFLLQFKNIGCHISSFTCESVWRHCFIEKPCGDWFWRFNDRNFDLSDKEPEHHLKKVEDPNLQAFLDVDAPESQTKLADHSNATQTTMYVRLPAIGKMQKVGNRCLMS